MERVRARGGIAETRLRQAQINQPDVFVDDAPCRSGGTHRLRTVLPGFVPIAAHVIYGRQESLAGRQGGLVLDAIAARVSSADQLERPFEFAHIGVGGPEHFGRDGELDARLILQQADGLEQGGHGLDIVAPQRLQLAVDARELGAQDRICGRLGRRSNALEQGQRLGKAALNVQRAGLGQAHVGQQGRFAQRQRVTFSRFEPFAESTGRDVEGDLRQPQAELDSRGAVLR